VEKLVMVLKEMQGELEGEMLQAIESHLLGRERTISMLKEVVPFLEKEKIRAKEPEPELINLIQTV
jgi:hypothetical protein